MEPWVELILVLAALYAVECGIWCRRGDTVFLQGSSAWRLVGDPHVEVGSAHGLVIGPLSPLRVAIRCRSFDSRSNPNSVDSRGSGQAARSPFDGGEIAARVRMFQQETRTLRTLSTALFVYVFAAAPAVLWSTSLASSWVFLLTGMVGIMALISAAGIEADRALNPMVRSRFERIMPIALSPASAMRAPQHLALDLLQGFHPLAIACVLCETATFRVEARKAWFDARRLDSEASDSDHRSFAAEIDALLDRSGGRRMVTMAPSPQDMCRAFCPRCEAQYVEGNRPCADCGVPLAEFVDLPRAALTSGAGSQDSADT